MLPERPIAIIDDDASVRCATGSLLRSFGYATSLFESAEAFLEAGDSTAFPCVIADIQMPGMSGIELARRLASDAGGVPVILMTAHDEEHGKARALGDDIVCVLMKPFTSERLVDCLQRALAR